MPQSWFDLAADSRKAANRLVSENFRSCLCRAYYAVYSKVTFDLSGVPGVVFPAGDEGRSIREGQELAGSVVLLRGI
jgi:hypothetical protein